MVNGLDWPEALRVLERASPEEDVEDLLDGLLETLSNAETEPPNPVATDVLLRALSLARSALTRRDLVHAIARITPRGRIDAVDAVADAYRSWRDDAFLAPEALHALAILAEREPLARAALMDALLRLTPTDSRFLLIRGAKVIGRMEILGLSTSALDKLEEWRESDDPAVQAEARQQAALISLSDCLGQADLPGLRDALHRTRVAFHRAELSEELRVDAALLRSLIDLLLAYLDHEQDDADAALRVGARAEALAAEVSDPLRHPWYGYASGAEQVIEYRIYRVADGFQRIVSAATTAEEWIRVDEALLEIAAILRLMAAGQGEDGPGIAVKLGAIGRTLVAPRLGPFLGRTVGRARLRRVIEAYEVNGPDELSATMRRLHDAACAAEYSNTGEMRDSPPSGDALVRLVERYPEVAARLCEAVPGAEAVLRARGVEVSDSETTGAFLLPTDHPGCYGNDPSVDEAVRRVLAAAWERLGPSYPMAKRVRFRDLVVSLIQIAGRLRDNPPSFALCAEDRGKGQQAREGDLQEYVFERLSEQYGRMVLWEANRISGGRSDTGIQFPECFIPIEVKAEFRDITREHVRDHFLSQADDYATARDQVACLLILDLRDRNAERHRDRHRRKGAPHPPPERVKLYSLRESFWIDGLPPDPQVYTAEENAVLVGLYPGNRPRPSSMTTYSSAPVARNRESAG